MSEQHPPDGPPGERRGGSDLEGLRARLDRVQARVEQLGSGGALEARRPARSPLANGRPTPPPLAVPASGTQIAPPPPGSTSGGGERGVPPPVSVTVVDAGPLASLDELRDFEQAVLALPTVHEVCVRRLGSDRARIEIAADPRYPVETELTRLQRPVRIAYGAAGELIVELDPLPPGTCAEWGPRSG